MKKYFTELEIEYNKQMVSIRDLIDIHGFKTDFKNDNDDLINQQILLKSNIIYLRKNNDTITVKFNITNLCINSVSYSLFNPENPNVKIFYHTEFYDNGQLAYIRTINKKIEFHKNGKISSILKQGVYNFNEPYYLEYNLDGILIKEKYLYRCDHLNREIIKTISYYINGNKCAEIYSIKNETCRYHNLYGPAKLKYNIDGTVLLKEYYYCGITVTPYARPSSAKKAIASCTSELTLKKIKLNLQCMKYKNLIDENEYMEYIQLAESKRVLLKMIS